MIKKTANNLQPLDSFVVHGSYADSTLKLYGKEITIGAIVIILLLVLLIYLAKHILKHILRKLKLSAS